MSTTHPAAFLRRYRSRACGTLLVWAMGATLAAAALLAAAQLDWIPRGVELALTAMAAALLLLGIWFKQVCRLTPVALARELDQRWALHSRLESAMELSTRDTGWAAAQRDDAARQLTGRKPPGALAWFAGHIVLVLVLALMLVEGTALAWRTTRATPAATAVAKVESPKEELIRASIEWKSPESEIKATAIEEVPLTALAESNVGFRSVSLELVINGDREVSQQVDAPTAGAFSNGGAHELRPSLFLDELGLKEGDLVTYRLVAEVNAREKRTVSSPLQFVEIRRLRRDASLQGGGVSEIVALLFELKGKQLQLLKQNFTLAQLTSSAADPTWPAENVRVASEQDALGGRAQTLIALLQGQNGSPEIVGQVTEAKELMHRASKQIAAKENESALKPQNRALALITDIAKLITPALSGEGAASDPIRDEQTFKLPPRNETPAGDLEQLAERQRQNNRQLASGETNTGANAEQAAIARDATKLGANSAIDSELRKAVDLGAIAATEAARQLSAGDRAAARVPGAEAQRAFEHAMDVQEKAGRAAAVAELDHLRRALNDASRVTSTAERAQKLAVVGGALRAAAELQQRSGSAEAAQDLAQLAGLVTASQSATDASAQSTERAREVALAAARVQVGLTSRGAALSRTVRLLNRVGQRPPNSGTTRDAGNSFGDLEIASQEAQWITGDAPTIELARQLATQADALQRSAAAERAPPLETAEGAVKLAAALERGRTTGNRDEIVRRFSPADIDPLYRTAVDAYFERLSREGRRPVQPPAK